MPERTSGASRGARAVQPTGIILTSPSRRSTHTPRSPLWRSTATVSPSHGWIASTTTVVSKPVVVGWLASCSVVPGALDEGHGAALAVGDAQGAAAAALPGKEGAQKGGEHGGEQGAIDGQAEAQGPGKAEHPLAVGGAGQEVIGDQDRLQVIVPPAGGAAPG